ncbi:MAG: 2-oxoglutarate dehydrogenase, E2 component, dihydrolipoamide succinyltransferase, partial [Rhodothermales bacterium]
ISYHTHYRRKPRTLPMAKVEVEMPKMGESITEGTIIAWHKQVGDVVELDETLLEIGTDKVDTEVPSPAAGTLQEVLVEEGDTVEVGMAIAKIATGEGASTGGTSEPEAPQAASQGDGAQGQAEEPQTSGQAPAPSGDGAMMETEDAEPVQRKGSDGRFYSPLVRSIAEKEGLSMQELESIEGSGREGRVSKEDVLEYVEARQSQPAKEEAPAARRPTSSPSPAPKPIPADLGGYDGRVEIIEMDRMRQIIAEHMVRSKATSAHVTSFTEADVTNLVKLRDKNKASFQKREGVKLTYTPFFVQAAVEALREHPILNSSVEEKRIVIKKDFHIGIAVALGKTGLLAPVVRDAGQKNISGLARTAADLAERARKKQLQPDELQGGTFTVTNIGSLGSLMGTPIINQPQVGILAVGAIKKRPVVIEDPTLGDIIAIRSMMYLSLSYDHRIIDGAMGASFLHKMVEVLESYDANAEL